MIVLEVISLMLFESRDLKNWVCRELLKNPGWRYFNTSLTKGPDGYVLCVEASEPAEYVGVPFTAFFAFSPMLSPKSTYSILFAPILLFLCHNFKCRKKKIPKIFENSEKKPDRRDRNEKNPLFLFIRGLKKASGFYILYRLWRTNRKIPTLPATGAGIPGAIR